MSVGFDIVTKAWMAYLYFKRFNKSMDGNFFESFAKQTADMQKISQGLEFSIEWFLGVTQKFLDYL